MPKKTALSTQELIKHLRSFFKGEIKADQETLEFYSHDTSIFEVKPQLVVFPKNSKDLANLVGFVSKNKKKYQNLSLTGRSGGSDMTGGSVNESIIVDFKHFDQHGPIKANGTKVQPGLHYRDFEPKSLKKT